MTDALRKALDRTGMEPNTILVMCNDLVAASEGVFAANGSGSVSPKNKLVLKGSDAAPLTAHIADPRVLRKILSWLGTP